VSNAFNGFTRRYIVHSTYIVPISRYVDGNGMHACAKGGRGTLEQVGTRRRWDWN